MRNCANSNDFFCKDFSIELRNSIEEFQRNFGALSDSIEKGTYTIKNYQDFLNEMNEFL